MAAKLYYAYIALSRVFAEIFQKVFSPHSAHNPETRRTFALHRVGQKQGDFKLPPFCFCAENDFESDFENESENDYMFHVKLNHKKPIYGQKIILPRFSFVKNFFQKKFLAHLPPESQKEKAPRGEPSRTYENCSIC